MHRRLTEGDFARRFVCLTFDDGYRDTLEFAYPILKAAGVPFAVYVATSFADRLGELWWLALEAVIAKNDQIGLVIDGDNRSFDCASVAEKRALYDELYWWLRRRPTESRDPRHRPQSRGLLSGRHRGVLQGSVHGLARARAARRRPAGDHRRPYRQSSDAGEAAGGRRARGNGFEPLGDRGGAVARPQHLAYPFGDATSAGPREFATAAALGFKTAVTTRPGVIFAAHRERLTALPRISFNGEYQQLRYVRVLLSGSATAMWNGFRRQEAVIRVQ